MTFCAIEWYNRVNWPIEFGSNICVHNVYTWLYILEMILPPVSVNCNWIQLLTFCFLLFFPNRFPTVNQLLLVAVLFFSHSLLLYFALDNFCSSSTPRFYIEQSQFLSQHIYSVCLIPPRKPNWVDWLSHWKKSLFERHDCGWQSTGLEQTQNFMHYFKFKPGLVKFYKIHISQTSWIYKKCLIKLNFISTLRPIFFTLIISCLSWLWSTEFFFLASNSTHSHLKPCWSQNYYNWTKSAFNDNLIEVHRCLHEIFHAIFFTQHCHFL